MSELALLAMQRVVLERPPAGTLRRGLVSLPPAPVVALVAIALAALIGAVVAHRRRAPR